MKKLLIVCINFNSYNELNRFLFSIYRSISACNIPLLSIDVYIADNSTDKEKINQYAYVHFVPFIKCLDNLGYLGGASAVINEIKNINIYDYIIISNVDLELDISFIPNLLSLDIDRKVAWIAPQIYSKQEGRDKNPRLLHRYSKIKLYSLLLMYKFPFLHRLYNSTLYKRKKNKFYPGNISIYAGHGSCIVLTKGFFNIYPQISYPVFLYCEELFLAELIRKINMHVLYLPTLKIIDSEHVSTSKMNSSFFYKCNIEAIRYILKTFY